jgi:hypothetical protein
MPKPVMILGLPRSGTLWVERLFRYSGYLSLNQPFVQIPGLEHPPELTWNGIECPFGFIQRCHNATPSGIVFRWLPLIGSIFSREAVLRLSEICDTVICYRHPVACYTSFLQVSRCGFAAVTHEDGKGGKHLLSDYRFQEPTVKINTASIAWGDWTFLARWFANFPTYHFSVLYKELVENEDKLRAGIRAHFGLVRLFEESLPLRIHTRPIQERVRNWDEVAPYAEPLSQELNLELV